ncbi:MAG: OmcA/MtrC family decaheme c-type cytochrome, partial [Myxococcales bacterium]|nr:OmcA/MtrC family decaheme c-type cytochrome [Myxococcales bacterium]
GIRGYITREATAGDVVATQLTSESNGTLTPMAFGEYSYTFNFTLPDDVDRAMWHRVVIGARRSFDDGSRAGVSASVDFVPDGSAEPVVPDTAMTDRCNQCHQGVEGHGGRWTGVDACLTCHTPQTTDPDTGNTVDFRVMLHRIHMGAGLPSVQAGTPYQIIGNRGSVHDFSEIHLPRPASDCQACHGEDVDEWPDAQYDACTACHDRTAFTAPSPAGFTPHTAGVRPLNSCAGCHPNAGTPTSAAQTHAGVLADPFLGLVGLRFAIDQVTNVEVGQLPVVTFHVFDGDDHPLPVDRLDSLEITMAGPTSGFAWASSTRNVQQGAQPAGDGWRIQLAEPVPDGATGSVAVGMAGYRYVPYGAARAESVGRENGGNPVAYAAIGGGQATPPATEVTQAKCNACHGELEAHGGFRTQVVYCQTCHNATGTDAARRPPDAGEPASIFFGPMVHRIHAGEHLENPPVIYGFGGTPHDSGEVVYPGVLNNCAACH